MKYKQLSIMQARQFLEEQRPLWACAYEIDNETLYARLKQVPVEGILVDGGYRGIQFARFGANGRVRQSGLVHFQSRRYADTYEEAVELYNELVQKRELRLRELLNEVHKEYLSPHPPLPDADGWYPVREGYYPKEETDVQVTYLSYFNQKPYSNQFAYRKDGLWYWVNDPNEVNVDIIAWKPGTPPYKEEL